MVQVCIFCLILTVQSTGVCNTGSTVSKEPMPLVLSLSEARTKHDEARAMVALVLIPLKKKLQRLRRAIVLYLKL